MIKNTKTLAISVAFLLLSQIAVAEKKLSVVYVYDENFPRPFEGKIVPLLEQAAKTLGKKLGGGIEFEEPQEIRQEDFFARHLDKFTYKELYDRVGYPVFKKVDNETYLASVGNFLERWELEELKSFFPDAPADADRAWVARSLLAAYAERIAELKDLKYADGRPFLEKKGYTYHSYLAWATAASTQQKWEIVVTNAPIVYDHITQPYPHNVLKRALLGGVSLTGQVRGSALNRVILLSLATFAEGQPSFLEESLVGRSGKERMKVAASYLLAHELGHAVYLVPDVYNHGVKCLMNTTLANMDYWSGYRQLVSNKGRCALCSPYRRTREKLVSGDRQYAKQKYEKAFKSYRQAEELLPERISGERPVVLSRLMLKQLKCLVFLGKREESLTLVDKLVATDPENKEFRKLRFSIKDLKKDVWELPEDQKQRPER